MNEGDKKMKGEIDKDFYCVWHLDTESCPRSHYETGGCNDCKGKYRKWPTLEQFKKEYGEEWDGACYALMWLGGTGFEMWRSVEYSDYCEEGHDLVCACTPWGKPETDWRPEC